MNDFDRLVKTARKILRLLALKRYEELALLARNNYSKDDIRFAMDSYDATAIEPTESFDSKVDVIRIEESFPIRRWSVIFPVWTREEGESDLSVNITCIDIVSGDETFDFELNGIYVM